MGDLTCECGGQVDAWKGNGPRGRYVYCECSQCQRKTPHFSTQAQAKVAWRRQYPAAQPQPEQPA